MACNPSAPPLGFPIHRVWDEDHRKLLPYLSISLPSLVSLLQDAYGLTTAGSFRDAVAAFKSILQSVILLVVGKRVELDEVSSLSSINALLYLMSVTKMTGTTIDYRMPRVHNGFKN